MASLQLVQVAKRFGATTIVPGLDLVVDDGEFVVLVGPSGCGKSTLLRMVAGLEPVSGGRIRIGGVDRTHAAPKDRQVAMVFQDYALYPHMTVQQNLAFGLKIRGLPAGEISASVQRAARTLEIEHLLARKPAELSGGQRQRVAMGRCLVRQAEVFLFDEPLSNLDAKLRATMRAEIKRFHQRTGVTTLYVTHDQVEAMTLADRIVCLQGGVIAQQGSPAELYARPANSFVAGFIGAPPMNFLSALVVDGGTAAGLQLRLADGQALPVPLRHRAGLRRWLGRALTVGLRPEHLPEAGADTPADQRLAVLTTLVEPLGADTLVHASVADQPLIARCVPRPRLDKSVMLTLALQPAHLQLFDPDTGLALVDDDQAAPAGAGAASALLAAG